MKFNSIISIKQKVESHKWKDLGFDFEGETEALVFNVEIDKDRNDFMFNQYAKGYVKEHSVCYVLELAVNLIQSIRGRKGYLG
jgi:hypothetical protein